MSFQSTPRILALAPELVPTLFASLVAEYGEDLPDGPRTVRTIGAFWDDAGHTRKRAASLTDGTIVPSPLTDGRVAFRCLWQADLADYFDEHGLAGVEELSEAQFAALQPETEL